MCAKCRLLTVTSIPEITEQLFVCLDQKLTSKTTSSSKSSVIVLRHMCPSVAHAGRAVDMNYRRDLYSFC